MQTIFIMAPISIIVLCIICVIIAGLVYLFILAVKALRRYIRSSEVREEKKKSTKTLGEIIKKHRTDSKMSQEFVAEYLGVSRQAVSKWESGASDPSTSNLLAISKLFGITPEELLQEVRGE